MIRSGTDVVPTTLSKSEFDAEFAAIVAEMESGKMPDLSELGERLQVPEGYLVFLGAMEHMRKTGEPVTLFQSVPKGKQQ